jgi:tetratricopeptide (TPR) repeat protein/DNA-binding PadR family transcriptional regulator
MARGGGQARRRSYYVKKRVLSVRNAIPLHLLDYYGAQWPGDIPYGICQEGVAEAVEGHRGHVSRLLRELIKEGVLYEETGRVEGVPTRVKVYRLTEDGAEKAVRIAEETRRTRVTVVGEEKPTTLGELEKRYEGRARLLTLALHTVRRVFDPGEFEPWLESREEFVDHTKRMPVLQEFLGRREELDAMGEWYADDAATTLAVKGLPGIGKTALAAKFMEERRGLAHTFWYTVDAHGGLTSLLRSLAEFASAMGSHSLHAYVSAERSPRIEESLFLLEQELKGKKALLVIDDVHGASESVQRFLKGLVETLPRCGRPKLILVGREISKLYDRRNGDVREQVREIVLEGLDEEASARCLESKGVPAAAIPAILEATKGHPHFLRLFEDDADLARGNFRRFLREEVSERLPETELRVLRIASVYRTPVFGHGLLLDEGVSLSDVTALVDMGLLAETKGGQYELHDVLREFFESTLSEEERVAYHRGAAEYYRILGDPSSTREALFHLLEVGERDAAIDLAVARGREVLAQGVSSELLALLGRLLDLEPEGEDLAEILLVMGEASFHAGDWESALAMYQRAFSVSEEVMNEYKAAEALRRMGLIHLQTSDHDLANDFLMASLKVSRRVKDLLGLAKTYYELANLHSRTGPYSKVRRFLDMSLKWAERSREKTAIGKALFALGSLERTYGKDIERALRLEEQALELFEEDGAVYHMARAHLGIGHCLATLGRDSEAVASFRRSLELYRKAGNVIGGALVLRSLAGYLISRERVQEAEPLLDEALGIFSRLGNRREVAFVHLNHAGLYGVLGQHDLAIRHLDHSVEAFESLGEWVDLTSALTYKGQLLAYMGKPDEAAAAFKEALASTARIEDERLRSRILRQARAVESGKESIDFTSLVAK